MKLHFAFAALAALTLCACTDFRGPASEVPSIESGYTPIALAPPPPDFCEGAATSDRLRAETSGFDAQTVDRMTAQSLQQCHSLLALQYPNAYSPAARVAFAAQ